MTARDDDPIPLATAADRVNLPYRELVKAAKDGRLEVTGGMTTLAAVGRFIQSCRVIPDEIAVPTVYVIGLGRYIKIGFTNQLVQDRFAGILGNYPEPVVIHAVFKNCGVDVERELHRRFKTLRSKGEWFRHRGNLRKWIKAGCPYP